jgi:hypothetical protein
VKWRHSHSGRSICSWHLGPTGTSAPKPSPSKWWGFSGTYHAILGRPAYAKFMVVPNYTYLKLKIPVQRGSSPWVWHSSMHTNAMPSAFNSLKTHSGREARRRAFTRWPRDPRVIQVYGLLFRSHQGWQGGGRLRWWPHAPYQDDARS